nr:MAG TPA: hypothetical protein [Caudoviricetes sp.]
MTTNKNERAESTTSASSYYPFPKPTAIDPKSILYSGSGHFPACTHRKDKYDGLREEIELRLDDLMVKVNDFVVEKRYGEALNYYVHDIFPTALKLIVNIERWIAREKRREMEKRLARSVLGNINTRMVDPEELTNKRLKSLAPYFYGMMNEQIVVLIEHLKKCRKEGKNGWDPSFLRRDLIMRLAELYRGEFRSKNYKKKPEYVGEKYRYLITRAVFTSWKMFLFMYSLDTGNGFPALKEKRWFKLDKYLDKTETVDISSIPKEKDEQIPMIPTGEIIETTEAVITGLIAGTVSEETIKGIIDRYRSGDDFSDDDVDDSGK